MYFSAGRQLIPITAVYGTGDANFTSSSSAPFTQTVSMDDTSTSVSSSTNLSVYGQSVTFTATVTANSGGAVEPSGTVTFEDGATSIGTGVLNGATTDTATFTTNALAVSSAHAITVVYNGDGNFNPSPASNTVPQTVNLDNTTTSITASSANPSSTTQNVTFTATVTVTPPGVSVNIPTGTVTFSDGGTSLGTASISAGTAIFTTATPFAFGSHTITAQYSGDTNDQAGSPSSPFSQTALQATTTTLSSNSTNPSMVGDIA